jgi:AP-1 complex subunit beta-1
MIQSILLLLSCCYYSLGIQGMTKVSANIKQFSKGTNDDAKFFNSDKKSEIVDLRKTLQSSIFDVKRDGIKKVIALMTLGKDVSQLFPDVIHCIQTESLELKKLVYLYLINYAKVNPDLTLMAVNTFVKDASDPNPLVRALSIRTMGCIRIEKISEYLCEPLRRGLRGK